MYGLFLYKEITSQTGDVIYIAIEKKDFSGEALEMDAISGKGLQITLDNQNGDIFTPIIKSSVTLSLVDTGQIDYSLFYTPDSTKYRLTITVNEAAQWIGYLTPDSFTENLQFRGSVDLVFRDNLGLLGEIDYNFTQEYTTINDFILAAFGEISLEMNYEYKSIKYTGATQIKDLIFDSQIADKTWLDILTELLTSLGLQMRFVGNNTIRVFDIGDLRTLGGMASAMEFKFVDKSGMREIVPAWRELKTTQDYQLRGEVFEEDTSEGLTSPLSYTYTIPSRSPLAWKGTQAATLYNYGGNKLTSEIKTINPDHWGASNKFIYLTGCTTKTNNGVTFSQYFDRLDSGLEISFTLPNVVCFPIQAESYDLILDTNIVAFGLQPDIMTGSANSYSVNYRFNVFYETAEKTYVLRGNWDVYENEVEYIEFSTSKNGYRTQDMLTWPFPFDDSHVTLKDEKFTIDVMTLPAEAGKLKVKFYEWYINEATPRGLVDVKSIAVIKDISIKAKGDLTEEKTDTYLVSSANIKQTIDLSYGQVPEKMGGIGMYKGGLYSNTEFYAPVYNFNRGGSNYPLSMLVSGELIHHFKNTKNRLSGNILPDSLICFDSYFQYQGKDYLLNYSSLNLLTGQMNVELVEVTNYTDPLTPTTTTTTSGGTTTTSTTSTTTTTSAAPRTPYPYYGYSATSRQGAWDDGYPEFTVKGAIYYDSNDNKMYTALTGGIEIAYGWYLVYVGATIDESTIYQYGGAVTTTTTTSTTTTTTVPPTTTTTSTSTTTTSTTSTTTTESWGLLTIDWSAILGTVGVESVLINDTELMLEDTTSTTYVYRVPQNLFGTGKTIKANLNLSSSVNTLKGYDDADTLLNTLSGVTGSHLYQFTGATINANKIARVLIEDATPPPTTTTSTSTTTSTTLPEEYGIVVIDWEEGSGTITPNHIYINDVELTTVIDSGAIFKAFMIPSSLFGTYSLKVNVTQSDSNTIAAFDSNNSSLGSQSMGVGTYDYTFNGGTYVAFEPDTFNHIARVNIYV